MLRFFGKKTNIIEMKQKITLVAILGLLIALLYAFKTGIYMVQMIPMRVLNYPKPLIIIFI